MRFRFLSLTPEAARTLALSGKSAGTGAFALGAAMCLQSVLAGPLHAAPTLGGDEGGPAVRILQPSYQDVLKGKAKILIGIQTGQYNPEFIEMLVDDRVVLSPTRLGAMASSQFDWDTSMFSDGPHKLTVRVTDTQGFRGWAEVTVYLNNKKAKDYTPPSLDWLNVKQGEVLSGMAQIQLQAVDNFGVKWIIVSVNPEDDTNRKPPLRSWLLNRPPYRVNFDTRAIPDGIYVLNARAWDPSEQEGVAPQLFFGIANNPISFSRYQESLDLYAKQAAGTLKEPKTVSGSSSGYSSGYGQEVPAKTVKTPLETTESAATSNQDRGNGVLSQQASKWRGALNSGAGTATEKGEGTRSLLPSAPSANVRTVPATKQPSVAAKPTPRVAAVPKPAQVAPAASKTLPSSVNTGAAEARPATTERETRVATLRTGEPAYNSRTVDTSAAADLSARKAVANVTEATRIASLTREDLPTTFTSPDRLSTPGAESRTILDAATWSVRRSDDTTVAVGPARTVRPVEGTGEFTPSAATAPAGEQRQLPQLAANIVSKVAESGIPVLAPLAQKVETATSGVKAPTQTSEDRTLVAKVAAPEAAEKAEVPAAVPPSVPQLSKPRVATNIGATPSRVRQPRAAITVAPLEVSAGKVFPAFHKLERTAKLRDVAARYGIPVEVLATCNNWTPDAQIAAGTKVKFPQELRVSYGGKPVDSDVASLMVGSTSVTAFRFLWEQQGGKLEWDAKNQQVVARNSQHKITLTIGSKTAKIDDREVMMELAAFLMSGRTMVPVRVFEEGLHAQVEWDPSTGRLYVAMAN